LLFYYMLRLGWIFTQSLFLRRKAPLPLPFFGVKLISLRLLILVPHGFQDSAISSL